MPAKKSPGRPRKVGRPAKKTPKKKVKSPKKKVKSPKKKSPGRPRKVGRPLGSKNKKKAASPKRKPGRPRKVGRPKGSRTRRGASTREELYNEFSKIVMQSGETVDNRGSIQDVGICIQNSECSNARLSEYMDDAIRLNTGSPTIKSLTKFRDEVLNPYLYPQQDWGSGMSVGFGY